MQFVTNQFAAMQFTAMQFTARQFAARQFAAKRQFLPGSIRLFATLGVLAGISLVQGCDSLTDQPVEIDQGGEVRVQTPAVLREVAKIDPDALILEVLVNDQATVLTRTEGDLWTGVVNVPANQTSTVVVRWGQNYGDAGYIPLAEQRKSVFSGAEGNAVSFNDGYVTDTFNRDNDAYSNLLELQERRSPVAFLDATINVDGAYPTGGISYPPSSECGSQLPVDILIEGSDSAPADLSAWWCATYVSAQVDGQGNTLPIESIRFVVNVIDDILFNDSAGREHEDDSIELYIDSNNSKRSFYDGLDDYQLRFVPSGSGLIFSGNSLPVPADLNARFIYFTGGYRLIAYVPIASTGIANARAFGFNVEVNDDDDGGDRDAKYGWIGVEGRDIAWRNPSAFGTTQIP